MNWACSSKEAVEHEKNCKDTWDCEICAAILSTSVAMEHSGTEVRTVCEDDEPHPLTNYIINKFGGQVE